MTQSPLKAELPRGRWNILTTNLGSDSIGTGAIRAVEIVVPDNDVARTCRPESWLIAHVDAKPTRSWRVCTSIGR
jgi:hypothetical protein